ncbi:tryptophan synthase subunit beta [Candidatus Kaiserbacteria bacterium RIFCSPHIGHO2_02_FULL_50_9]|uniref:Tryptophan synthase beta chain n=1 Tax=Candidatus Kaiserbacteria bacterium RIFCSPLOWO2_01_FULL_51_21 TaxID=1798508 RepID=A0A1F6EDP4_9BACT|nr:MAG: tryptophan synthase subunit beta [Candidatus Kaiserbacteria bacterium RIFCSPHIGHO2_01_FULL_51_33]OGG63514.1 MAG: tryptophan synthase subunit beta [Candidatus Kaiserbacteria bacterium RIFCSPHIGHO2_02_FULL_50_9]OGG71793.1 MAG: tryptophan synthase subunit beta [Candidatus Kaiserbacteria bacterium RIFCSPLOWO2_01_FULL_51_21]
MQNKKQNYGGAYVPEMLLPTLHAIEKELERALKDPAFIKEFQGLLKDFAGRPTPLTFAKNITEQFGGAKCYLKNEGLNHTGAHKITHCIGQALIAKRLGKTTLIAETGAGQHGLATATVAAKLGFKCKIFMGSEDMSRQRPNVFWMERLGAEVIPVTYGSRTLKDAVNEALKYWMQNLSDTHYVIGSVLGPSPYPRMNRVFQSVVGREVREQMKDFEGKLPDVVIACVGGGSNAMGIFSEFLNEKSVSLVAVEAGGVGNALGEHASKARSGELGIAQGYKSLFLQDNGQIAPTHSISAGLDYPGLGPELAALKEEGRVEFQSASDSETLSAVDLLARTEGIIPALESAHALAYAVKLLPTLAKEKIVVVNISGRGDKDLFLIARAMKDQSFRDFLLEEHQRYE